LRRADGGGSFPLVSFLFTPLHAPHARARTPRTFVNSHRLVLFGRTCLAPLCTLRASCSCPMRCASPPPNKPARSTRSAWKVAGLHLPAPHHTRTRTCRHRRRTRQRPLPSTLSLFSAQPRPRTKAFSTRRRQRTRGFLRAGAQNTCLALGAGNNLYSTHAALHHPARSPHLSLWRLIEHLGGTTRLRVVRAGGALRAGEGMLKR